MKRELYEGGDNILVVFFAGLSALAGAGYFGYDRYGNQYKSWYHWADANDPNTNYGTVTNLTKYDWAGRAVESRRIVTNGHGTVADSNVLLSRTSYNRIGQVDTVVNEHGMLTKYEYDHRGGVVEIKVYADEQDYGDDVNDPPARRYLTITENL
ncbi:MAG: hypothetical protein ACYTEX_26480, partial [Planctomycetota bacterium]